MVYRHRMLTSWLRICAFSCLLLLLATAPGWSAGPPQLRQASVNGAMLSYVEQGSGAPVLFVHGCCTDARAWEAQREAVAAQRRFIALNLRYHGTAAWTDDGARYGHQAHADDIAAFIRGLNAGPVDLVGWSYSGLMVALVAAQHPELVRSLTIHEPAFTSFITDPVQLKAATEDRGAMLGPVMGAVRAGDNAGAARLVPTRVNDQADFWNSASAETGVMFAENARTLPLAFLTAPPPPPMTCAQLGQFRMPALMTYGGDTRPFYRIATAAAAGCIPGAQLVAVPGGRHLAMVQQPEAFNAILLQFLSKVGPPPKL